jgi:hypothetical protein
VCFLLVRQDVAKCRVLSVSWCFHLCQWKCHLAYSWCASQGVTPGYAEASVAADPRLPISCSDLSTSLGLLCQCTSIAAAVLFCTWHSRQRTWRCMHAPACPAGMTLPHASLCAGSPAATFTFGAGAAACLGCMSTCIHTCMLRTRVVLDRVALAGHIGFAIRPSVCVAGCSCTLDARTVHHYM